MKTIILFRHGKSDLIGHFINDHDRPLTNEGINAAEKMGKYLSRKNEIPDIIISSTAKRAKHTADAAMKKGEWGCPITFNNIIYSGSTNDLLTLIKKQNNQHDSICIVGHEPKFSNFIDRSTNNEHTKFSTGSMAKIDFDISKWRFIEFGFGNLDWLISPKELNKKRGENEL